VVGEERVGHLMHEPCDDGHLMCREVEVEAHASAVSRVHEYGEARVFHGG
jgi:hypothetical protein